jgi:menaquinone-dependent protoporphyrinogen IX oxidase
MMEPRVLVAYATLCGSTEDLASTMAEVLRDHGARVDVYPARELAGLEPYDAVVLVAALYIGRLHRHARGFLKRHQRRLETRPVALLVPGPVERKEKDFAAARGQLEKHLARFPWLSPVAVRVVGGVFDPHLLPFPYTLIPALRKMPPKDARDSRALRASAEEIAGKLLSAFAVRA